MVIEGIECHQCVPYEIYVGNDVPNKDGKNKI